MEMLLLTVYCCLVSAWMFIDSHRVGCTFDCWWLPMATGLAVIPIGLGLGWF